MHIELFPRISDRSGTVDAMVALFEVVGATPPALRWSLAGEDVAPTPLLPLQPVRAPEAVAGAKNTHTGLYSFEGLTPGRQYKLTVTVPEVGLVAQTTLKVPPSQVPAGPDGGLHVLLASCFYVQQANPSTLQGTLRAACGVLPRRDGLQGPDLALLMGDQVYLDMPLSANVPSKRADIERYFEDKYASNWRSCLAHLFRSAPHLNLPDDHEFWNNYPYAYSLAANTWKPEGRRIWADAAKHMMARFQHVPSHRRFDVAPVSFFVADGRSERDCEGELHNTLTPDALKALAQWVEELNDSPQLGVGVFVSGQSMLSKRDPTPLGRSSDATPANYADYAPTLELLLRLRRPLLLVTGDVHWGRVVRATRIGRHPIHEIIVSPLSSVKDQRLRALSTLKRVVGIGWDTDWDSVAPEEPPYVLAPDRVDTGGYFPPRPSCGVVPARSTPDRRAMFRGDQLAVLSFHRTGGARVSAKIVYWMIRDRPVSYEVPLFDLVP